MSATIERLSKFRFISTEKPIPWDLIRSVNVSAFRVQPPDLHVIKSLTSVLSDCALSLDTYEALWAASRASAARVCNDEASRRLREKTSNNDNSSKEGGNTATKENNNKSSSSSISKTTTVAEAEQQEDPIVLAVRKPLNPTPAEVEQLFQLTQVMLQFSLHAQMVLKAQLAERKQDERSAKVAAQQLSILEDRLSHTRTACESVSEEKKKLEEELRAAKEEVATLSHQLANVHAHQQKLELEEEQQQRRRHASENGGAEQQQRRHHRCSHHGPHQRRSNGNESGNDSSGNNGNKFVDWQSMAMLLSMKNPQLAASEPSAVPTMQPPAATATLDDVDSDAEDVIPVTKTPQNAKSNNNQQQQYVHRVAKDTIRRELGSFSHALDGKFTAIANANQQSDAAINDKLDTIAEHFERMSAAVESVSNATARLEGNVSKINKEQHVLSEHVQRHEKQIILACSASSSPSQQQREATTKTAPAPITAATPSTKSGTDGLQPTPSGAARTSPQSSSSQQQQQEEEGKPQQKAAVVDDSPIKAVQDTRLLYMSQQQQQQRQQRQHLFVPGIGTQAESEDGGHSRQLSAREAALAGEKQQQQQQQQEEEATRKEKTTPPAAATATFACKLCGRSYSCEAECAAHEFLCKGKKQQQEQQQQVAASAKPAPTATGNMMIMANFEDSDTEDDEHEQQGINTKNMLDEFDDESAALCPHCCQNVATDGGDMETHLQTCQYRPVMCDFCQEVYSAKNAFMHAQCRAKLATVQSPESSTSPSSTATPASAGKGGKCCNKCGKSIEPQRLYCPPLPCPHCRQRFYCDKLIAHLDTCNSKPQPSDATNDEGEGAAAAVVEVATPTSTTASNATPTFGSGPSSATKLKRSGSELDKAKRELQALMAEQAAAEARKRQSNSSAGREGGEGSSP